VETTDPEESSLKTARHKHGIALRRATKDPSKVASPGVRVAQRHLGSVVGCRRPVLSRECIRQLKCTTRQAHSEPSGFHFCHRRSHLDDQCCPQSAWNCSYQIGCTSELTRCLVLLKPQTQVSAFISTDRSSDSGKTIQRCSSALAQTWFQLNKNPIKASTNVIPTSTRTCYKHFADLSCLVDQLIHGQK
jgi:hypothetical protein